LGLELAAADHALQLAEERAHGQRALADAVRRDDADNRNLSAAAEALGAQLTAEFEQARAALESVPEAPPPPPALDPAGVQGARREAEQARRAVAAATSAIAGLRTRREFLEEQLARSAALAEAADRIPAAEAAVALEMEAADAAEAAAIAVGRLRSELEGLDALRPAPAPGLVRLGEVITPEPGYEAALSAALGALVDALVAADESTAMSAAPPTDPQRTVLYPSSKSMASKPGSLIEHVSCAKGYELVARRLLGHVVIGADVSLLGVYREDGLVRAGADPRVEIDARRSRLRERIAGLEPKMLEGEAAGGRLKTAEAKLAELRALAAGATRLDESKRMLEAARSAEQLESRRLPELERLATAAEEDSASVARELEAHLEALGTHRATSQQAELERARWRDRIDDLRRQLRSVEEDLAGLRRAADERATRVAEADGSAIAALEVLPALKNGAEVARTTLAEAERESPEEEAEIAEGARRLGALEEDRIDARLKAATLEGNLELVAREGELLQARMEEIRSRMPDGIAPEEVPGGKAREREMRALERRLEEIGPTNALAETECRELEERFETLRTQLEDISAAREDLEQLIAKLREEEESRYEAVFGAVAANFHEYFSQLAPGGRATLKHADGDDGPRSGVEILVQPPRKRLQNVTLLSSGERSLAALALVLALDEVNPSPFTILDEVDAALDDANVGRFGEMLARLGSQRQFLVITHNHVTMSHASSLYGIHLDESGSSHLVSVRLEDIRKPAARTAPAAQAG
jgi:chromosome segregation protein